MSRSRTPERIAETALALFNAFGEPNVTTNRIADELEISPGNLHYHFRTKQDLIDTLFSRFEHRMLELLGGDGIDEADVEDAWLFLHLVFENIAAYRFIYRDLNELCTRSRNLRRRIRAILKLSMRTASDLLAALERSGQLEAMALERESAVRNIVLISSYWIAFDQVMELDVEPRPDRAAIQVMSLVSPYLRGPAREQFEHLANAYR
ncbi:MAG: TetR/AcrR family transcriptional regulator [Wenzhouxiangellaceae bacterium]|nr:TetR/AcrR family transcriptional regulator [Wenzhouxiangellaceae bacterium]MBS3745775.1 TetR/AcrR family transcriptional regulator [Wenzhouxiangellaceae bacterium]MBS3824571.1 TetR/AcrR family transcriptional regulator [Wenzhouxiangellaceae bacterium]